jgi:hypothetical protein
MSNEVHLLDLHILSRMKFMNSVLTSTICNWSSDLWISSARSSTRISRSSTRFDSNLVDVWWPDWCDKIWDPSSTCAPGYWRRCNQRWVYHTDTMRSKSVIPDEADVFLIWLVGVHLCRHNTNTRIDLPLGVLCAQITILKAWIRSRLTEINWIEMKTLTRLFIDTIMTLLKSDIRKSNTSSDQWLLKPIA